MEGATMFKNTTPTRIALATAATLLALPASSQDRVIYGPDGRISGRIGTDTGGSSVVYDAAGRVAERCSKSSTTITCYGSDGRVVSKAVRR
jgi:hypothetical protein